MSHPNPRNLPDAQRRAVRLGELVADGRRRERALLAELATLTLENQISQSRACDLSGIPRPTIDRYRRRGPVELAAMIDAAQDA